MKLNALLTGVLLATAFTAASALPVVSAGNNPQPDQSNVIRNACGLDPSTGTGTTVNGCLNDDHSFIVDLTSDETISFSGGQATVTAADDSFSRLTVSASSMTTLILNIDSNEDGFVTFTDGSGTTGQFALDDNGQNFFTITGITGNSLSFVAFNGQGQEADIVDEVRQIRLGGQVTAIPEPETYALMMAGLAAVGFISRRRKTKK